jgi:hypothetical protein
MSDPLEGCRKKIARADEHLQSLQKAVEGWGRSYPYGIDQTFEAESSEYVLRIQKVRDAPLIDWGIVIGDAIHSLRSTLDHLVCVMIRVRESQSSCAGTGFPILTDAKLWDKKRKNGSPDPRSGLARIRGVDHWTEMTIKGLQPFSPGKQQGRDNPLWILNHLANVDKHRTLHVVEFFHYAPEISFDPPSGGEVMWVHSGGPLEHGSEVLRFRDTQGPRKSRVETTTQIGADIVFGHGSLDAEGMDVFKLLGWLRDYVEWAVDLFGYKFFGGKEPHGLQRAVIPASASVSVSENE